MKKLFALTLASLPLISTACTSSHGTGCARDITPGNCPSAKLDWRYGANDIKIQTSKLSRELMDRWFTKTNYKWEKFGKPRIMISEVDNCTEMNISTEMIRDIFEGVAISDGRFSVLAGNPRDLNELKDVLDETGENGKFSPDHKPRHGRAKAAQFMAKVRLTKAGLSDSCYEYEAYRMSVTLYDVETMEAVDSAVDILKKRVEL